MGTESTEQPRRRTSLMDAFMIRKASSYHEPRQRGVPRGRPMGFSTAKFKAAVYCLKSTPLKEIALAVPVSYGLLRKWRTEKRFLSLMLELGTEFVDKAVMRHLKKRAEVQMGFNDAYSTRTIIDTAKTPPPQLGWAEFGDVSLYSEEVLSRLANEVRKTHADLVKGSGAGLDDVQAFKEGREDLYQALQCEGLLALLETHGPTLTKDPRKHDNPVPSLTVARRDAEYERSLGILVEGPLAQDERKRMIAVLHRLRGRYTLIEMEQIGVEAVEARHKASAVSFQKPIGRHLL